MRVRLGLLLVTVLFMSGCSSLGYIFQAAKGQLSLLNRARPIADVIRDPRTPPHIVSLLGEIRGIKNFGESRGLKATRNYEEYVKVENDAVSYVVTASDPLEFKPKTWKFPIAGSFTYLGWFDPAQARAFAEELRKEGLDVDVRGAGAYSTLGWFRDPVLSTMLSRDPEALGELVNVVLHESVHATVYLSEQSTFNESVASFIADEMTEEYFMLEGALNADEKTRRSAYRAYADAEARDKRRRQEFYALYGTLDALYRSPLAREEKLKRKSELIEQAKKKLGISRSINNATLIQFKTYRSDDQGFSELFKRCGKNWSRMLESLKRLKDSDFPKPQSDDFKTVIEKQTC